ncbi:hypothetical protein BJV74DRAFT_267039 [Russula compacta]|nr:hypothetical protein BJV74DRAFT_267039 [Russula compacta]
MSSLHSCHWDWCRFTTVLHADFVQHVLSAHIDKAEPVKRGDISLIRHVEQGASGRSGGLSTAETSSQLEAPQTAPESSGPTANLVVTPSPHHQHFSKPNHSVFSKPANTQTKNHALSFTSGSTYILPISPQNQQTPDSFLAEGQSQSISPFQPQTQAAYRSRSFN